MIVLLGCSSAERRSDLAIYDWEAQRASGSDHGAHGLNCRRNACPDPNATAVYVVDAPKLHTDEVDRDSVRTDLDASSGEPVVYWRLTREGESKFEDLTRTLARRGAERRTPQHFLIVIDEEVFASPSIDYRLYPEGIRADSGMQISGLSSLAEANELAQALRGD